MPTARSAPNVPELKRQALAALDALAPEARELALRIHANPEIGFQERQAVEWVSAALSRHGYDVEAGVADLPTAITASWTSPLVTAAAISPKRKPSA